MDANNVLMNNLAMFLGFLGIVQGLGMKYSKAVRKKLMLDSEGIDKKYINFKINFLIITGVILLLIQIIIHFNPAFGDKMQILLSAFLLLSITADLIYKKTRKRKSSKLNYK